MAAMGSWPIFQLDIKNVFLHGDLAEEVYMEQPPGFVAHGESGLVCKLRCSLYGMKQSPRTWVRRFCMIRSTTDHSVFYHHTSTGQYIYFIVMWMTLSLQVTKMVFKNSNNKLQPLSDKRLRETQVFSRHIGSSV